MSEFNENLSLEVTLDADEALDQLENLDDVLHKITLPVNEFGEKIKHYLGKINTDQAQKAIESLNNRFVDAQKQIKAVIDEFGGVSPAVQNALAKFKNGPLVPAEVETFNKKDKAEYYRIRQELLKAKTGAWQDFTGAGGQNKQTVEWTNPQTGKVTRRDIKPFSLRELLGAHYEGYVSEDEQKAYDAWEKEKRKQQKEEERLANEREKQRRAEERQTQQSLERVTGGYTRFVRRIMALAAPLAGILSVKHIVGDFSREADDLGKQAKLIRMNTEDLYTWSKANEVAGGSAQAFRSAVEGWVMRTHRSAEDFIKLGQRMHGMSVEQQQFFLKTNQLSRDAMQIFMQSGERAAQITERVRKSAYTENDFKMARKFRESWELLKVSLQGVSNIISRVLLPIITRIYDKLGDVIGFLQDHAPFVVVFVTTLSALMAAKLVPSILKAVAAMKAFNLAMLMNPAVAITAGIVALAAALAILIEDLMGFTQGRGSLFEDMLKWVGASKEEIEDIRKGFKAIGDAIGWLIDKAILLGKWLGKIFGRALIGALRGVLGVIALIARVIGKIVDKIEKIKGMFGKPDTSGKRGEPPKDAPPLDYDSDSSYEDQLEEYLANRQSGKPKPSIDLLKGVNVQPFVEYAQQSKPELAAAQSVVTQATSVTNNDNSRTNVTTNIYGVEDAEQVGNKVKSLVLPALGDRMGQQFAYHGVN